MGCWRRSHCNGGTHSAWYRTKKCCEVGGLIALQIAPALPLYGAELRCFLRPASSFLSHVSRDLMWFILFVEIGFVRLLCCALLFFHLLTSRGTLCHQIRANCCWRVGRSLVPERNRVLCWEEAETADRAEINANGQHWVSSSFAVNEERASWRGGDRGGGEEEREKGGGSFFTLSPAGCRFYESNFEMVFGVSDIDSLILIEKGEESAAHRGPLNWLCSATMEVLGEGEEREQIIWHLPIKPALCLVIKYRV